MTDSEPNDETETETSENRLTVRRTFDAPRERVFRAFVDPDELEAWHSVDELTAESHTIGPEPDCGSSVNRFHGDDRYDLEGTFLEIIENQRLVHA